MNSWSPIKTGIPHIMTRRVPVIGRMIMPPPITIYHAGIILRNVDHMFFNILVALCLLGHGSDKLTRLSAHLDVASQCFQIDAHSFPT